MATSKDTKLNELVINETTEEILQSQEVQPNQLYITPDEDNTINFNEVKLSEFINDGNGSSPFATEDFVTKSGVNGLIDSISVNGENQTIDENKNVDITIPTKLSEFEDDVVTGKYLPLTGGELTGSLKVGSANIGTNGYVEGTWLKTTSNIASNIPATKIAVIRDQLVYTRTPEEILSDISALSTEGGTVTGDLIVNGQTTLKNTTVGGDLTITGKIYVDGGVYTTLAEELKIEDDYIILRNGAETGIGPTEYSGLEFHNYDGNNNDLRLVVGNDGVARVGDKEGTLQALATREDKPNANALAYWDSTTNSFKTDETLTKSTIAKSSDLTNYATTSALNAVKTTADSAVQTITGSNGVSASKNGTGVTVSGVNATQSASGMMSAADKKSFDRELRSLIPKGSSIPANADLNTIDYLKVGSYYCISIDNAKTIKNCPTQNAFIMEVFSLINKTYDNETTSWCYRYRLLTTYKGEQYWQFCQTKDTAGEWTYNDWNKVPAMSDLSKYLPLTGGTMKGELRVNGGDATGVSKIVLETNKGQITNSSTGTLFGYTGTDLLSVGHSSANLQLRGTGTRPTYNGTNIALSSDIPSLSNYVDKTNPQEISGLKTFKTSLKIGDCTITYNSTVKALEISVQ